VVFENPLVISTDSSHPDKIHLTVKNTEFLTSEASKVPLDPDLQLQFDLPVQYENKAKKETIEKIRTALYAAVLGNIILLIIMQFLFGQVIKKIWPLFFIVQFLLCFKTFKNSPLPPVVHQVLTQVEDTIEMNALPKKEIYEMLPDV
jgi:hypothetical protein